MTLEEHLHRMNGSLIRLNELLTLLLAQFAVPAELVKGLPPKHAPVQPPLATAALVDAPGSGYAEVRRTILSFAEMRGHVETVKRLAEFGVKSGVDLKPEMYEKVLSRFREP